METDRRWHGVTALLLAATVAACGSQSQADEAEENESTRPAADAPAAQQEEPTRARAEDATQPVAQEPAPERTSRERASTSTPAEDPPAEESSTSDETPTASDEEAASEEDPAPPATATVAAGTNVSLVLDEKLSTDGNRKGDSFSATVTEPVIDGSRVLIPEGSIVRGTVTAVQKAEGDTPATLTLDFESIEVRGESVPLAATLTAADAETDKKMKGEGKKIGGGAAAGGLLGGLLGKDVKSVVIGAAVGSAAGTVITLATREGHAVLPAGSAMEIRVDESLDVRI